MMVSRGAWRFLKPQRSASQRNLFNMDKVGGRGGLSVITFGLFQKPNSTCKVKSGIHTVTSAWDSYHIPTQAHSISPSSVGNWIPGHKDKTSCGPMHSWPLVAGLVEDGIVCTVSVDIHVFYY